MSKYYNLKPQILKKEDIQSYDELLDFSVNDKEITNVAISGTYGSGKSSIIKTYFSKKEFQNKFLVISLANFEITSIKTNEVVNDDEDKLITNAVGGELKNIQKKPYIDNKDSNLNKILLNALERKILQHLIFTVDPSTIPKSNLSRIRERVTTRFILYTLVFIALFLVFVYSSISIFFLHTKILLNNGFWIDKLCLLITLTLLLFWGIYFLVYRMRIKNLETKFFNIEILDTTQFVFEKYFDEIRYFFNKTKFRYIIFEDLDRYEELHIFSNLRELNILLNNSKLIDKPVKFYYAMNDYIIEQKNQNNNISKFFDLIIPIIPTVTTVNSNQKLKDLFSEEDSGIKLNEMFIDNVSLFLGDYRILKNIYNEYKLFHNRFSSYESSKQVNMINNEKLFSMIIYKNKMPKDYAENRDNKGFLFNFFTTNKNKIINLISDNSDKKIEELTELINKFDEIYVFSENMQKNLYEYIIFNKLATTSIRYSSNSNLRLGSNVVNISSNSNEEIDNLLRDKYIASSNSYSGVFYNDLVYNMPISPSDKQSLNEKYIKLKETLSEEYKRNRIIKNSSMEELLVQLDTKDRKTFLEDFSPAIRYLIENGYIDKNYNDYINYNYLKNANDRRFLLNIIEGEEPFEFDYELDNPQYVYKKLNVRDFNKITILNYAILDFLLNLKPTPNENLNNIFNVILKNNTYQFIYGYLERNANNKKFIEQLIISNQNLNIIDEILKSNMENKNKSIILFNTIQYLDDDEKILDEMKNYFKTNDFRLNDFNKMPETEAVSVKKQFNKLTVLKIHKIFGDFDLYNIVDEFLSNRQLVFSKELLEYLAAYKFKFKGNIDSYTELQSISDKNFQLFIKENIDLYINDVMVKTLNEKNENSKYIVDLLKISSFESSEKIINNKLVLFSIDDISQIDLKLWPHLIGNNKIEFNIENLVLILLNKEIDIKNSSKVFNSTEINNDVIQKIDSKEQELTTLFNQVMTLGKENLLNLRKLKKFIQLLDEQYIDYNVEDSQVDEYVAEKLIDFDEEIVTLIKINKNKLLYIGEHQEKIKIYIHDNIAVDLFIRCIETYLSEKSYQLLNDFVGDYDEFINENINHILEYEGLQLSESECLKVSSHVISENIKNIVLLKNQEKLNDYQLVEFVTELSIEYINFFNELGKGNKPKIQDYHLNKLIVDIFVTRKLITIGSQDFDSYRRVYSTNKIQRITNELFYNDLIK